MTPQHILGPSSWVHDYRTYSLKEFLKKKGYIYIYIIFLKNKIINKIYIIFIICSIQIVEMVYIFSRTFQCVKILRMFSDGKIKVLEGFIFVNS